MNGMNEIWIIVAIVILFVGFGLARRGKGAGSCGCAGVCEGAKKQNLQIGQNPGDTRATACCEESHETSPKSAE